MQECAYCRRSFEPATEGDRLCPDCRLKLTKIRQQQAQRPPLSFWLHSPTVILIAINVLVFLAMVVSLRSAAPSAERLLRWGANYGPLTLSGQWWRLLASAFLHANILHLALNMWAFLNLGILAELIFGRRRFVLLYLFCALGGSIASVWWHGDVVGVGASGAIFGIAGALLPAMALQRNRRFRLAMRGNLASIAAFVFYNIAFGAAVSHIDNAAHIGGLATGAILGALLPGRLANQPQAQFNSPPDAPPRSGFLRPALIFSLVAVLLLAVAFSARRRNRNDLALAAAEQALRAGDQQQALVAIQRTLQNDPNNAEAHYFLGYIYLTRNDFEHALPELKRTVELRPKFADGYSQLCVVYLRMRSFDEAAASCRQAIALDPKDPDKQYNLGLAEMALRDYPAAVQSLQKAADARPNSLDENYRFALALFLNGDRQRAETQLNRVLQIAPDFKPARDLLGHLQSQK